MPTRDTIWLHGSYRNGNFGDWLILRGIADEIRAASPGSLVVLPFGDARDQREVRADGIGPERTAGLRRIVFGGGGYFGGPGRGQHRWELRNVGRHLPVWAWGRAGGIPHGVFAAGVGPLSGSPMGGALAGILRSARTVVARDSESVAWCRRVGCDEGRLREGVDWVLGSMIGENGASPDSATAPGEDPSLAVHIPARVLASSRTAGILAGAIRARARVLEGPVRAISDNIGDDPRPVARWLETVVGIDSGRVRAVPLDGVDGLLDVISRVTEIITTKLHVGIVGVATGRSVWAPALHPKITRFYEQVGLEARCLPIWAPATSDEEIERFLDTMRDAAPDPPRPPVERLGAAHEVNRSALHAFLRDANGGKSA